MTVWTPTNIERALHWTFERLASSDGRAARYLEAEQDYVSIWLRTIRLRPTQLPSQPCWGLVHSTITMPNLEPDGGSVSFSKVGCPVALRSLNEGVHEYGADEPICLLDQIPYRGGRLLFDLGLFLVPAAEQSPIPPEKPWKVSVFPTVNRPVKNGNSDSTFPPEIGELAQAELDGGFEAGVRYKSCAPQTGSFGQIGLPRQSLDLPQLSISAADYRLLDPHQQTRGCTTLTLTIEADPQKQHWYLIPQLPEPYRHLQQALLAGSPPSKLALDNFIQAVQRCRELLPHDSQRLVALVRELVEACERHRKLTGSPGQLPPLADLPLYSNGPAAVTPAAF